MPAEEICETCANAILAANNGDTVNLCSVCCRKGDAVQAMVGWRCVSRREIVRLNFDPPVMYVDQTQHVSAWSRILTLILLVGGLLLVGCCLVWGWQATGSTN